jgi:hypothetical protein
MVVDPVADPRFYFGRDPNLSSSVQTAAESWTSCPIESVMLNYI